MNLYNLTGQYLELLDMASENDPAFADTLESITAEIATKADDYVYVMQGMDDQLESISKEIERLTDMKKAIEDNYDNLEKSYHDIPGFFLKNKTNIFFLKKTKGNKKLENYFNKKIKKLK